MAHRKMLINQRDRKLYMSHHHLQGAPTSYSRESRKIVWSPFCLGLSRPFPPPYHSADWPKLLFLISPGTAQCLPSLCPYATYEGLYIRTVAFPCKWQGVCAHFVNSSANQDSTLTEVRVQIFPLPTGHRAPSLPVWEPCMNSTRPSSYLCQIHWCIPCGRGDSALCSSVSPWASQMANLLSLLLWLKQKEHKTLVTSAKWHTVTSTLRIGVVCQGDGLIVYSGPTR